MAPYLVKHKDNFTFTFTFEQPHSVVVNWFCHSSYFNMFVYRIVWCGERWCIVLGTTVNFRGGWSES